MERLGETGGFGWFILDVLSCNGWSASIMRGFAGESVIVELTRPGLDVPVRAEGKSVAEVAPELLKQACRYRRLADRPWPETCGRDAPAAVPPRRRVMPRRA